MDARGTDNAITCPPHAGQHFRRKRYHHRNLDDDSLNMNEIEDRCISLHTFIPYLISLSLQQNQSETNQITLLLHHHQFNRLSIGPMASKLALTLTPHRFLNGHIQKPLVSFSSSTRVLSNGKQLCCRHRLLVLPIKAAADQQAQVEEDNVVDSKILPYCSIDKKEKKSLGEMEQEFLQALQAFYYEGKAIMSNEEFDNLKEELTWEGSSVVMLSSDEQKFLEASMAYVSGKPVLRDEEFDDLKLRLKMEGSEIVVEGPRCSLRSRKVYSDLSVDYLKMVLLNVPATVVALGLVFARTVVLRMSPSLAPYYPSPMVEPPIHLNVQRLAMDAGRVTCREPHHLQHRRKSFDMCFIVECIFVCKPCSNIFYTYNKHVRQKEK
ncbi:hypothetical protein CXB51_033509 [Gossypium anomalum]|uniref:PGR5-like protein 1A, chloroplastic n=1 Tax=Gossypium anomalum TaxID=47600 RepID=A0A8J5YUX8_9ROSI|nr:hypothetical protein CXB51_033509 [Gossypium anomalum]